LTDKPRAAAATIGDVLAAIADPTRRQLLDLLGAHGDASATSLADGLSISRQAVAKHLAILDAAGLVTSQRVGREVRFAVRPAALDATAKWMDAQAARWDRRLADIKRLAEASEAAEAAEAAERDRR
jgi:DNA-binding transcriptional ArsR family regulator